MFHLVEMLALEIDGDHDVWTIWYILTIYEDSFFPHMHFKLILELVTIAKEDWSFNYVEMKKRRQKYIKYYFTLNYFYYIVIETILQLKLIL